MNFLKRGLVTLNSNTYYCIHQSIRTNTHYDVVIAGGGSGGISVGARLARKLGVGKVAIIEPSDHHYYQPIWTLVGAGAKPFEASAKKMDDVMPANASWFKNRVVGFDPENNVVNLCDDTSISYKYLVVAMGLQLAFEKIKGLPEAFDHPGVCSNYSPATVGKTLKALEHFQEGNAIFTFPPPPLKCPGAPQKIMYLADEYFRKNGKRDKANILFNSAGPAIFAVAKYAKSLNKVVSDRDIKTNFGMNLIEVKPEDKIAVFQKVSAPEEIVEYPYELLHISPPMGPSPILKNSKLVDAAGFVDVDKTTTQHNKYKNVFSLGDCSSIPTSKTAAAVATQNAILAENLLRVRNGDNALSKYDGYTSCPLITGYNSCILAEFDFDLSPLETFPFDQGKERKSMYHAKADIMPNIYWNYMLKGRWAGPKPFRKLMHLGLSK